MSIKMKWWHYFIKYILVFWKRHLKLHPYNFFVILEFLSKPGKPILVLGRHIEMFTSLTRYLFLFSGPLKTSVLMTVKKLAHFCTSVTDISKCNKNCKEMWNQVCFTAFGIFLLQRWTSPIELQTLLFILWYSAK